MADKKKAKKKGPKPLTERERAYLKAQRGERSKKLSLSDRVGLSVLADKYGGGSKNRSDKRWNEHYEYRAGRKGAYTEKPGGDVRISRGGGKPKILDGDAMSVFEAGPNFLGHSNLKHRNQRRAHQNELADLKAKRKKKK